MEKHSSNAVFTSHCRDVLLKKSVGQGELTDEKQLGGFCSSNDLFKMNANIFSKYLSEIKMQKAIFFRVAICYFWS